MNFASRTLRMKRTWQLRPGGWQGSNQQSSWCWNAMETWSACESFALGLSQSDSKTNPGFKVWLLRRSQQNSVCNLYSLYVSKFDAVSSFKFPSLLRDLWDSRKASRMWRWCRILPDGSGCAPRSSAWHQRRSLRSGRCFNPGAPVPYWIHPEFHSVKWRNPIPNQGWMGVFNIRGMGFCWLYAFMLSFFPSCEDVKRSMALIQQDAHQ